MAGLPGENENAGDKRAEDEGDDRDRPQLGPASLFTYAA